VGSEYRVIRIIGQGSYGSVAEAIHKATQKVVAIKRLEDIFADLEDCKKMVRELLLLRQLNDCPFVTKILDIIEPPSMTQFRDLYFVMEYVESDLKKIIKS
jgi:serine/threonine protein kinase